MTPGLHCWQPPWSQESLHSTEYTPSGSKWSSRGTRVGYNTTQTRSYIIYFPKWVNFHPVFGERCVFSVFSFMIWGFLKANISSPNVLSGKWQHNVHLDIWQHYEWFSVFHSFVWPPPAHHCVSLSISVTPAPVKMSVQVIKCSVANLELHCSSCLEVNAHHPKPTERPEIIAKGGHYSTHAAGPDRGCVCCCFLLVKCISVLQPAPVPLCLTILIGKAPHCLYAGESLCGHLVGLSQRLLNLCSNSLKHGWKHVLF